MKLKIILISFLLSLFAGTATAEWLTCDPQEGVVEYGLTVDGVDQGRIPAEADGRILWNVDHLSFGPHTFILKAYDSSGWGSAPSDPLDARKPGGPGNARITE